MKLPVYAGAGIAEVWIVDFPAEIVEVHRDPEVTGYSRSSRLGSSELIRPAAFPDVRFPVSDSLD